MRDTSSFFGSAAMRFNAGTISVPPPPRTLSIVETARSMFAADAGTARSCSTWLEPENSNTLNVSLGRSWPISLRSSVFAVSNG